MQSLMIYGPSGGPGKTTLCGQFARHQAMALRAPCLYIGSDSGWTSAADEVAEGMMIPYNLATAKTVLFTLRRLARGFWPADLRDGFSIGTDTVMKRIEDLFPVGPMGYRISGICLEGLTRNAQLMAATLVGEMQQDTGQPLVSKFRLNSDGKVMQSKADLAIDERSDEESFAMNSQGTYSAVQQWTLEYVQRFKGHPHCPRLLVTAHQGEGKSQGLRVLGPIVMGNALVGDVPGWFDSCFHVEIIPSGAFGPGSPEQRALWYRTHPDMTGSSGLMWPAKLGTSPRVTAWFRANYSNGFINSWIDDNGILQGGLAPFLAATATPGVAAQ